MRNSPARTMTDVSPAVRALCDRHDAAVDLVMDCIYGFLDQSPRWNITMAALNGHLLLVQRLSAQLPRPFDGCCTEAMDAAAEFGHLEIVQWLHVNRKEGCTTDAMTMAAGNGHLEIVQWLHTHRREGCTKAAMDFAAQHGHLKVLRWLHANRKEGCTRSAMDNAAKGGHLHVVQWLHANRSEGCSKSAFNNACSEGHRDVAQWLLTHRPKTCNLFQAVETATAYGHPDIAKWLHEEVEHAAWDEDTDDEVDQEWTDDEGDLWLREMLEDVFLGGEAHMPAQNCVSNVTL